MKYNDIGNIVLNQIYLNNNILGFNEVKPFFENIESSKYSLTIDISNNIRWDPYISICDNSIGISLYYNNNKTILLKSIISDKNISLKDKNGIIEIGLDSSINISLLENNRIKETEIYYKDGKVGIGRLPLFNYKFDLSVPENTLMTAFHVGDGKFGFSMGNGTNEGFIPEIIGIGSDENDPGLYFIGKTINNNPSNIPLIVFDARTSNPELNRPIFGVKSGQLSDYDLIIDSHRRLGVGKFPEIYKLEVDGTIKAKDFVLDTSISLSQLIDIVIDQKKQIDTLKNIVTNIVETIK